MKTNKGATDTADKKKNTQSRNDTLSDVVADNGNGTGND